MTTNANTVIRIRDVTVAKQTQSDQQALEKPHPAPARWQETYDAIKEMRSRFPAPVDTMRHAGQMEGDGSSGTRRI